MRLLGGSPRGATEALTIPAGALAVSLVLFGIFVALAGANPLGVYETIYSGAFGSWFSWQNTLQRATPLMLTALCTALPARLGLVVIGAEGALWIALAGGLRYSRGVNETISSLLLNYIAIAVMNHAVGGPMRDPMVLHRPSSWHVGERNMVGLIPGMDVHWGLVFGVVGCIVTYVLMQHTVFGFAARIVGGNVRAARMAGVPVGRLTLVACLIAGAAAGLAGTTEIAAVHGRASTSLVVGYGYTGILVAFLARQNPLAVIPVAILLGGIDAAGGLLQRWHDLPDATVHVMRGIIFLVILASEPVYGRLRVFQQSVVAPSNGVVPREAA